MAHAVKKTIRVKNGLHSVEEKLAILKAEKPKGYRRHGTKLVKLSDKQLAAIERNQQKPGEPSKSPGRPKGIVEAVRQLTDDGLTLVQEMWAVVKNPMASTRDRIQAIEWLADRGYGKAPQQIVVTPTNPVDSIELSQLPNLDALRDVLKTIDVPPPSSNPEDGKVE